MLIKGSFTNLYSEEMPLIALWWLLFPFLALGLCLFPLAFMGIHVPDWSCHVLVTNNRFNG